MTPQEPRRHCLLPKTRLYLRCVSVFVCVRVSTYVCVYVCEEQQLLGDRERERERERERWRGREKMRENKRALQIDRNGNRRQRRR